MLFTLLQLYLPSAYSSLFLPKFGRNILNKIKCLLPTHPSPS